MTSIRTDIDIDLCRQLIDAAQQGDLDMLHQHVSVLPFVRDEEWGLTVLAWSAEGGPLRLCEVFDRRIPSHDEN